MSEIGNQSSLAGKTVTEEPESPDAQEGGPRNGALLGIDVEPEVNEGQSPAAGTSTAEHQADDDDSSEEDEEEQKKTLSEFGIEDDPRPNNPKLANPDGNLEQDRRVNKESDGNNEVGKQEQLFPDVEDDQITLGGERARNQCLF